MKHTVHVFMLFFFTEEAAADDKRGKLYKPKSKIPEAKTFLPLETPPQFLALDKRNVSFTQFLPFFFLLLTSCDLYWKKGNDVPKISQGIEESGEGEEKEQPGAFQRRAEAVSVGVFYLSLCAFLYMNDKMSICYM